MGLWVYNPAPSLLPLISFLPFHTNTTATRIKEQEGKRREWSEYRKTTLHTWEAGTVYSEVMVIPPENTISMFHLGFLFHKFTIHAGSVNTSQTWDVMIDSKLLLPIIIIWLCWSLQEYPPSFGKWCNIHFIAFNVKLTMLVQYPKTTKLDILTK